MKKIKTKLMTTIMIMLLLASIIVIAVPVRATPTIQELINTASPGATITLQTDTYNEGDIDIDKPLTIQGAGKSLTIIDSTSYSYGFKVSSSEVTIKDLTVRGSGLGISIGVSVENIDEVTIENTIVDNFYFGIYMKSSSYNVLSGNTIIHNSDGIRLITGSSHNTISENNIEDNLYGIQIESSDNTISGNTISENLYGIFLATGGASNNIITRNIISNNDVNGIRLHDGANNNEISKNVIGNHWTPSSYSIRVTGASYNQIFENDITNNKIGVSLEDWDSTGSSNNKFYHNNFISSITEFIHAILTTTGTGNLWDDGYPSGGNYWSSYIDVDKFRGECQNIDGSDGIWDHPYVIIGDNIDDYPFVGESGWIYVNQPPVAVAIGPSTGDEGSTLTFDGTASYDPDGTIVLYEWDFGDGYTATGTTPTHAYGDNGIYTVTLSVTDGDNGVGTDTLTVTVNNVAPTVGPITAPQDPVQVGTAISASADFTDPGVLDTHIAEWDWGDGIKSPAMVVEVGGSGTAIGSHTYTTPGVYTLTLTVTDDDLNSDIAYFEYVVVYDPYGGFVTGGGWIDSPEGAYTDTTLTGKATFGFVSKYKKGATTPIGQTQFVFHVADLNFHSTSYQWLVVAGPQAKFKGSGTINGEGDYGFMLTAVDGQQNGGGGVDKFRIKIWVKATGEIIYDNQMGDTDDAEATDAIEGGSIVIHNGK